MDSAAETTPEVMHACGHWPWVRICIITACYCLVYVCPGLDTLLSLMSPARGGLLWRTAKADVLGEMGLPAQCHHTTILRLSAIERHWYNRCARQALSAY